MLGKTQINLVFLSLNRTFVAEICGIPRKYDVKVWFLSVRGTLTNLSRPMALG